MPFPEIMIDVNLIKFQKSTEILQILIGKLTLIMKCENDFSSKKPRIFFNGW
jgi:hypothetical protein